MVIKSYVGVVRSGSLLSAYEILIYLLNLRCAAKTCCKRLLDLYNRECLQHFLAAQRVAVVKICLKFYIVAAIILIRVQL